MDASNRPGDAELIRDGDFELRARACAAAEKVFAELLDLSLKAKSESVKLAAIKEMLDRGFGRVGPADRAGGVIAHVLVDDGYQDADDV
jgi:hypothetical protein